MLQRFPSDASQSAQLESSGFDIRDVISFAIRQWKVIASATCIAGLIGAIQLARTTPLYTATTQVLLDPKKSLRLGTQAEAESQDFDYNISRIENEIAVIRSISLMKRVVDKERLTTDSEFGQGTAVSASFWSDILKSSRPSSQEEPSEQALNSDAESFRSARTLSGATSVSRAGLSSVLTISVTTADAQKSARLANAVADAYAVDKLDARFESAKRATAWLGDRLEDMRQQLRTSEEALAKFKAERGIVQAAGRLTLSEEQLQQLTTRLITARSETADKKTRVDLLNAIEAKGGTAQSLPDAMSSGIINGLRTQQADVSRREAELIARYGDNHPLVINIRAERRDVERAITNEIRQIATTIRNEYALAKAREDSIQKSVDEATGASGIDEKTRITLRELERNTAVNKALFEDFLQKSKISDDKTGIAPTDVRVMMEAQPPGVASSPKKPQAMGIALGSGILLGIGLALLKELLNSGFTTRRQIEEVLGLPVLASVSKVEDSERSIDGRVVPLLYYVAAKPLSRLSESVRSLRNGVKMADVDNPPRVILVTSTMPEEGKTTMATMLSASASQANQKVLLIDADLRRPTVSEVTAFQGGKGLVEVLTGEIDLRDGLYLDEKAKFWTLSAGGKTQNPPDLLASERMKATMSALRQSFDYIVIDSPPIGPVIDAVILSALADKIVYVVKWASTSRETVTEALRQFPDQHKISGVVLSQVNERQAFHYGKYRGSYRDEAAYAKYYGT